MKQTLKKQRGLSLMAVICGGVTAVLVSQVFEKLFYVRLP